jgi:hypothetical protein
MQISSCQGGKTDLGADVRAPFREECQLLDVVEGERKEVREDRLASRTLRA